MTKYLLAGAAAAAMIALAPAVAQTVQPAPAPNVMIQRAPMAAKVHTRADVGTHVRTMFERLDTNRDGYLTKAEIEAARTSRAQRFVKRLDRDAAGSPEQRPADRRAMFDRLDTNRDGSISRSEFEAAPPHQERRVVIRTDRDGAGVPGAMGPMRAMRMGMGIGGLRGQMFDLADTNRDGRVTLQEATAAAYRHFDMADANHDGHVTREERIQMHQRMRAERRPG